MPTRVRFSRIRSLSLAAALAAASAMLASCTPPPYGVNEPPGPLDRVRAIDLRPRPLSPSQNETTGSGEYKAQLYYGSQSQPGGAESAASSPGAPSGNSNGEGTQLDFVDAPVAEVAKVILGDILGVGYAIDPRVQGTVSLSSAGRPIPKSKLLFVLEAALRTANAVLIHDAGGYRIVPSDDAVGGGGVDRPGPDKNAEPGYGLSVIPLRHVSVQTVMKLLDSFAAKPGSVRADPSRNLILVVGNGLERRSAVDTVLSFDEDWMRGQSVGIFPVTSTSPEPLVAELEKILDSGEDGLSQHLVKLQPISRSNAILVVARRPELLTAAGKWISRLDRSAITSTGVKVYKVRYGDCRQIAKLLNDLFVGGGGATFETPTNQIAPGSGPVTVGFGPTGSGGTGIGVSGGLGSGSSGFGGGGSIGGGGGPGGTGGGPAGSGTGLGAGGGLGGSQSQSQGPFGSLGGAGGTGAPGDTTGGGFGAGGIGGGAPGAGRALLPGVRILPDIPNNTVVIYANAEQYRIIERALTHLDRPLSQVAVDVTIAEVSLNNNLSYGVQFFLGNVLATTGTGGTTTTVAGGPAAFNTATGLPISPRVPGFNFMIGNNLTPHVILSALNQYTTTKILANPSLVVLDNQVAALQVGQQVPVTTGSANILNSATTTSNTVFNSISYQNTGIILSFRPRIHANGNVNLEIDQEISACTNCQNVNLTPTFTNRHVRSQIQVPNGQTVLLAGLVQETHDQTRNGIPVVEQIPILGEAFTPTNGNAITRTELIIFIRPQVIRDGVDASTVAEELRSKMRGDKIGILRPPGAATPYPLGLVQ
ncbi:MAG TPA: type II secretion system secretin GspD [Methylocella sp.]|nr:type II secretion system secretin GspD [Methylocella sp.]